MKRKYGLSLAERLERHSVPIPIAGCVLWTGCANRYGHLRYEGRTLKAHRLAWELAYGPVPVGMVVCHRCDTPLCINAAHLFIGTQADNVSDCVAKGRIADIRGERRHTAKLTAAAILAIRADTRSLSAIGRDHGIGTSQVWRIRRRESWTHIDG